LLLFSQIQVPHLKCGFIAPNKMGHSRSEPLLPI